MWQYFESIMLSEILCTLIKILLYVELWDLWQSQRLRLFKSLFLRNILFSLSHIVMTDRPYVRKKQMWFRFLWRYNNFLAIWYNSFYYNLVLWLLILIGPLFFQFYWEIQTSLCKFKVYRMMVWFTCCEMITIVSADIYFPYNYNKMKRKKKKEKKHFSLSWELLGFSRLTSFLHFTYQHYL